MPVQIADISHDALACSLGPSLYTRSEFGLPYSPLESVCPRLKRGSLDLLAAISQALRKQEPAPSLLKVSFFVDGVVVALIVFVVGVVANGVDAFLAFGSLTIEAGTPRVWTALTKTSVAKKRARDKET